MTEDNGAVAQELRLEIEQARRELGNTVAAIAERADVKAMARAKVDDVKVRAWERSVPVLAGTAALAVVLIALRVFQRRRSR